MPRTRPLLVIAVALAPALLLACGGAGKPAAPSAPATPAAPSSPAGPASPAGAAAPAAPATRAAAAPAVPVATAQAGPTPAKAAVAKGEPSKSPPNRSAPAAPVPQPATITSERAEAIVWDLAETRAWADAIARRSRGAAHATTMVLPEDPETIDGKRYWSVNFYETQPDHIHRWQTFMVRLDGKEILVEADTGDHLSLQDWRAKQHPLARASDTKPK